jgi:hypothetical protein
MRDSVIRACLGLAVATALLLHLAAPSAAGERRAVTVNCVPLDAEALATVDTRLGFRLPDGNYWYDAASGSWGAVGGPAAGRLPPEPPQYHPDTPVGGMFTDDDWLGNPKPDDHGPDARDLARTPVPDDSSHDEDWAGLRASE